MMMGRRRIVLGISLACSAGLAGFGQAVCGSTAELDGMLVHAQFQKTLERNVQSVLPTEAENRWQTIPWQTNLMAARVEAQRLNKPMFLWVMNGNPMGCT